MRQALDANGAAQLVRSSVTFERFFFVTAYIMRKLKEADALTLDVIESSWPVVRFASIKPPPHRKWFAVSYDRGQTWRRPLEQHYDLARPNADDSSSRSCATASCITSPSRFATTTRRIAWMCCSTPIGPKIGFT
jgi:hypothetical protein